MKVTILTLFPEYFSSFLSLGMVKRAIEKDILRVECVNFREYAEGKHHQVDDTPYGGGHGMLLMPQPIFDAMEGRSGKVILFSPRGKTLTQEMVNDLSKERELLFLCSHYEGIDQRVVDELVDEEISIGDYIVSGGEIAAGVVLDALLRRLDGHLSKDAHTTESFENGLLEFHQYTRPADFRGRKIPEVLLSGDHEKIRLERLKESLRITYERRKDLWESFLQKEHDPKTQSLIEDILKEVHHESKCDP